MTAAQQELLLEPLKCLTRASRKSQILLQDPSSLKREEGQDTLDIICMQFLGVGEGLKRFERLWPGLLQEHFPEVDWKGAMGFRDVIAHQYFDLDVEQVLLICQQSLPKLQAAVQQLIDSQ